MKPDSPEFRIYQVVSGEYLTEEVPDDWLDMPRAAQEQFIEQHKWEALEYRSFHAILHMIELSFDSVWAVHTQLVDEARWDAVAENT